MFSLASSGIIGTARVSPPEIIWFFASILPMVGLLVAMELLLFVLRGTVVLLCENYWLRVCLSMLPCFFNMFIIKFINHITLITY